MTISDRRQAPYSRVREDDRMVANDRTYTTTAFNGTVVTVTSVAPPSLSVGEYRKTTDVVTPGYHTLIQQGRVINNPYNSVTVRRSSGYTGFKYTRNSGTGSTTRYHESPQWYTEPPGLDLWGRPSGVPLRSLAVEAGTLARAGINSPDVEGLVEMAEAKKALDVFRFRLNAARKYCEKMMRADRGRMIRVSGVALADVVLGNWMRYRYGIMPMIYLAEDALVGEKVHLERETSRGTAEYNVSSSSTVNQEANYYADEFTVNEDYNIVVRAGVLYRPDWHFNRFGLSARELPSAFIELTPYSWVADWFVNISPAIRALMMSVGTKTLASWTSYHEEWSRTCYVNSTWKGTSGFSNVKSTTGGHGLSGKRTWRVPGVDCGLTWRRGSIQRLLGGDKRSLDSLALTHQAVRDLIEGKPSSSPRRIRRTRTPKRIFQHQWSRD